MFSTSLKITIDPNDLEPRLVMVTTHLRALRRDIRHIVPGMIVCRAQRRTWSGFKVWMVDFKFPSGQADIDKVLRRYPPMKMQIDPNWGY